MATVLVVDDDADLTDVCDLVLGQHGHDVRIAGSAAEARKLLKAGPPDVVVLDIMMESDTIGFDLAREIHERFPALTIIVLSSLHRTKELPFRFEPDETWLPVLKFMDKPVDAGALADEVDRVVGVR